MSIIVVGSINRDISINLKRFPVNGETIYTNGISINKGGKGLNQALSISRQNKDVKFIGAVGDDDFGSSVLKELEDENIDFSTVLQKQDAITGTAVVLVDKDGDNSIMLDHGANYMITKEDISSQKELFRNAKYCVLQNEIPISVIRETLDICEEYMVKVVLNPAPFTKDITDDVLKKIDLLIPNEIELNQIINNDVPLSIMDSCTLLHKKGVDNLVVTLGDKGCYYSMKKGSETGFVEAIKVNVVDTTAAGDTFIGALVSQLDEGIDIRKALQYATMASAITITKKGAGNSIPTKKEILEKVKKNGY